jgi:hypothetical protein
MIEQTTDEATVNNPDHAAHGVQGHKVHVVNNVTRERHAKRTIGNPSDLGCHPMIDLVPKRNTYSIRSLDLQ